MLQTVFLFPVHDWRISGSENVFFNDFPGRESHLENTFGSRFRVLILRGPNYFLFIGENILTEVDTLDWRNFEVLNYVQIFSGASPLAPITKINHNRTLKKFINMNLMCFILKYLDRTIKCPFFLVFFSNLVTRFSLRKNFLKRDLTSKKRFF